MVTKTTLSSLVLLACSTAVQASDKTEIEFWHALGGKNSEAVEHLCSTFNEQSSTAQIDCIFQGDYQTAMQKAVASVRSKTHPVLMQFNDVGTTDVMMSGIFNPVEETISDADWASYISGARGYYESSEGKMMSQPWNSSTLVMYANKKALADIGIKEVPTTYETILPVLQKLKDNGHQCPMVTDGGSWRILEQVAARHGVEIASNANGFEGLDGEYMVNQGLIAKHLNNLKEWNQQGLLKLTAETVSGNQTAAMASGECALMESSLSAYGASKSTLGDDLELSLAPMYEGHKRHNTFVGGGSVWLLKGHDAKKDKAAIEFLNFLRQPEQQLTFTSMTGYLPVTSDGYEFIKQAGVLDKAEFGSIAPGFESLAQENNAASKGIRLGFYSQFRSIFEEETQKAFADQISMQQALDNTKVRGDLLLRRFERTYLL
ncbi:sn-glycerol 3-phosphate ABC transporter substrate-binding protein [Vibrio inusitatus NBRC 102082]|uniref:sn-glycerol-3-phosphate-binding periplasmic protein UgpB n=1 Tax=Vibrio inusitatus NBRC 102082 TaxID=1219070 RepID=A0A4Y3HXC2_9VIBR|nr:extracellular solute-binding protein [Vibrio inusitatus]GEA51737.1 sn-glycerol 3-phosphate ABC transporter substrate-binding protein [Vibrio inusitatus NBRC 102082]